MSAIWTLHSPDGAYGAAVLAAGGGLGMLRHKGIDLVAGPKPARQITGGRGQVLMPWPNRIRDGRYSFYGTELQLPITEPAKGTAIHGLVRWQEWHPVSVADDAVTLAASVLPQPGYPWELRVQAAYELSDTGLQVTLSATNESDRPAPFAAGMHPYLDAGCPADEITLTLPGRVRQLTDERGIPAGSEPAAGDHDFTTGRRIGSLVLDDAWTDLQRQADGWCDVLLEGAHAVRLSLDESWRWVQVFTGDSLADGRRQAVAVEPMTAPADAFNTGTDLRVLAPGEHWQGAFRIEAG